MAEKQTAVATPTLDYARAEQRLTFLGRFMVLKGAMPELWVTLLIKFLGVAAYQIMNITLVLWLSHELGYDDQHAGYWVTFWAVSMTVYTVLVGSLTDALGLRKTFLLGVIVCIFARLVMTFTTIRWLALGAGLIPLAVGEALGTPVLVAAIRRYSTTSQRSISFSLFYAVMNLGFLVAYYVFDSVRGRFGEHGQLVLLPGFGMTTYQVLFFISLAIEILILPVIYFGIRSGAEATDDGPRITPEQPRYPHENMWNSLRFTIRDTVRETVRNLEALGRQPGFYRLLSFLMLIAFLKLIIMTMYYVFPKFGIRELGPGAPIGGLLNINSILIIGLVPIVGALTQRIPAYTMVTLGGIMTAGSVFVMALPPAWFQTLADGPVGHWIGHKYLGVAGSVNAYYVMSTLFVVIFSLGEAFYSPRVYEYAAAIAPKGQEASYAALSYVPFLLAKLLVGGFGGILLAEYCPETGLRDSGTMWLIIAMTCTVAPLGLICFRRWIRVREAGRAE